MLCAYCSTENPEVNRFCGECGQPLVHKQVTVPPEPQIFAEPEESHQTTISGPSFLGLTDTSESDETDYLLEDDRPRHGHFGWFLFSAVAIAILGVIGWMEWQAIKTGKLPVPSLQTTSAPGAPAPATASATPTNAQPDAESVSASPAEQKPQSDGAESTPTPDSSNSKSPAPAMADATTADKKSDAQATQENESRIAKEADQRKTESGDGDDSEDTAKPQIEKPTPKAKPVSATSRPPDPRQNQMLISGEKYLYGRGVRQDCNQALIYFKAAAESENAPAMSHLGAMYASGHCVTTNRVMAYKWFVRASEHEPANQWISRSLNMLWRDMSPQERASVAR
jgi:cytoskeletal protein RodZ